MIRTRSDLDRFSGRFWSPDATWNRPYAPDGPERRLNGPGAPWNVQLGVADECPTVTYAGPTREPSALLERGGGFWAYACVSETAQPGPDGDGARMVVVDLDARTVTSGLQWRHEAARCWTVADPITVPLDDGDGWGSLAVGLILEREVLAGHIPHTVGFLSRIPDLYGRRVRLDPGFDLPRGDRTLTAVAVAEALRTYGGICTGLTRDPFVVTCERLSTPTPGEPGPTYRARGIGGDRTQLAIPSGALIVS